MLDNTWLIAGLSICIGAGLLYRHQKSQQKELEQTIETLNEKEQFIHAQRQEMNQQMILQASIEERLQYTEQQLVTAKESLASKDAETLGLQQQHNQAQIDITTLETQLRAERQSTEEKLSLLDHAKHQMSDQFKILSQQVFEEKNKLIQEENHRGLDEVLKPMREQLSDFRQRVDDIHTYETKERASLREHLNQLQLLNRKMSDDAINLTHALKGESKVQGNWGEMILERILESSGLHEGREFVREESFTLENGKRLRPDVIIYMPGDKQIIIDSKVSLTNYERMASSVEKNDKAASLKAHLHSLKSHIQELSNKRYEHLPHIHSPDYVLMFVPIEGAYLMAIEADSSMFEDAFEKHVAVVTPSTLYATLKLIEQLWRYERQGENVIKLMDRASKLHDKFVDFTSSFEEIGSRLQQAQKAYDTSFNRMTSGAGNVMRQIDQLGQIAGKTKKELPEHLIEKTGSFEI